MWVTFDVFTSHRMVQKGELEGTCNNKVTNLETWTLGKYTLTCNSDDYSLLR